MLKSSALRARRCLFPKQPGAQRFKPRHGGPKNLGNWAPFGLAVVDLSDVGMEHTAYQN